ncbi:hypothetical protein ACFL27_26355 [candidate division CSSED10-310 bacterium]|uniref:Uncharacterized protein n=1 Tax=candidate division CSSED10-310 bacterium TaxID=2855610 RepID=A0ABV6Z5J4_UNCC1
MSFTIGKPLDMLLLTTPVGTRSESLEMPIYTNPVFDLQAVRDFIQAHENESDINAMQIGPRERLIISSQQIIVRNKGFSIKKIELRLRLLNQIFERSAAGAVAIPESGIDSQEVPENIRDLIPLAEKWGLGDDTERAELWQEAPPAAKETLKEKLTGRTGDITAWLDSYNESEELPPAATGPFMWLLEGLDENGYWPAEQNR